MVGFLGFLGFFVTFLVTAVTFLIMIRVSIGLDVDSRKSAIWAAVAFGLFNAALRPLLGILPIPNTLSNSPITFLVLAIVMNAILLFLTSAFVKGFRINGCVNALIASITLGVLNTILYVILGFVGL